MDEATMAKTFRKVVFRARQTHTFKTLHSPASVSSTQDAHFQNQVSPRLRETLPFFEKLVFCVRKTTTLGGKAEPSPAQPSRAEPTRAEPSQAARIQAEPSRAGPSRAESNLDFYGISRPSA